MAGSTRFEQFIAEEIERNRGRLVPVRATLAERLFVKKARWDRLHPNPEDEFCVPSIGPNFKIISEYAQELAHRGLNSALWKEPLVVEKVCPDGYMLLNGHHRWGAAVQMNFNPLPISIVNLTQETDIEQMIRKSRHDKRVTLDLDEVVFCRDGEECVKPLPFPYSRWYKERIRRGIPALLHHLSKLDYDIWVYTSRYYSYEYIRAYFRHYSVRLDGIITGMARRGQAQEEANKRMAKLLYNRYNETLHIDRAMVLRTGKDVKRYEVYPVEDGGDGWAGAVMKLVDGLKREEG